MQIVKQRERVDRVEHYHSFRYKDDPGAGRSIPCDKDGKIFEPNPNFANDPERVPTLERWFAEEMANPAMVYEGLTSHKWTHWDPAVGLCVRCDREVVLSGFTNTCECGADYNHAGQLLAAREQWGEETGETVADILAVDYDGRGWE